ncbi:PREDICTED: protein GLUTAMINE DUMPER 3-like [Camelina sativa]|uniref:Protein GLUTAMINE DUMPER 3-like n=1 Tax=Camelina sativa TaxID=90675 RepID=A0ABM0V8V1_CAMSA|nr:PREDICTED: protein GLUTAMINE DUMPER 3-like [Camelina sativa]
MEGRQYYPPRENVDGNRTTMGGPHSPWHSPVPYLFGGLAAMLGLIAFALLILACSYWRLSGYLDGEEDQRDLEAGDAKPEKMAVKPVVALPEKFLVIMAGDVKPTYLATPAEKTCTCDDNDDDDVDDDVKGSDQVVRQSSESNGTATH